MESTQDFTRLDSVVLLQVCNYQCEPSPHCLRFTHIQGILDSKIA
ncbi:hypothetical protein [uncultured Helicobacter sp.]